MSRIKSGNPGYLVAYQTAEEPTVVDFGTDILQVYNEKKRLIDVPQNSLFLTTADSSINATTLRHGFSHWLNFTSWPAWDVSSYKMHAEY